MANYTANYTTINVQKHRVGKASRTRIPRIPTDLCDPVANNHPFNPCQSVFKKILRVQISPCSSSNYLPSILHLPPQHRAKDHLYVLPERIIPIVIAVESHLVGIDDRVVILHRYVLRVAGVTFLLFLGDVFCDYLVFEPVFQGGRDP